MGWIRDIFTVENALRGTGIVCLATGLPLAVVPAIVVSKLFNGSYSDSKLDDATEFGARAVGILSTSTSIMGIVQPSPTLVKVKIAESAATLALTVYNRVKKAEENPDLNRKAFNILIGFYSAGLLFLLLSQESDEPKRGETWQKMLQLE